MNGQLQFKAKCTLKENEKSDMLVFDFFLGPLHIVCLVNVPNEDSRESIAYVIAELEPTRPMWEVREPR